MIFGHFDCHPESRKNCSAITGVSNKKRPAVFSIISQQWASKRIIKISCWEIMISQEWTVRWLFRKSTVFKKMKFSKQRESYWHKEKICTFQISLLWVLLFQKKEWTDESMFQCRFARMTSWLLFRAQVGNLHLRRWPEEDCHGQIEQHFCLHVHQKPEHILRINKSCQFIQTSVDQNMLEMIKVIAVALTNSTVLI